MNRRVGRALDAGQLPIGNDAVRYEHGTHAELLRTPDILEQPVADVHRAARVIDADRIQRSSEGLRMWLGPGDLRGVDRGVDQMGDTVALEDSFVLNARPDRIGQDTDL